MICLSIDVIQADANRVLTCTISNDAQVSAKDLI